MTSTTVNLYPISQVWKLVNKTCSTKPGYDDRKIYFHPPVGAYITGSCNALWVTDKYQINLQNPTLSVMVGGSYGGWHATGGIEFDVYAYINGSPKLIYTIKLGDMSPTPQIYDIGKINSDTIFFAVRAYSLTCVGCAPWVEPVSFTVSGTLPPPSATINMQVKVVEAENPSIPIKGAKVMLTSPSYGYQNTQETDQYGYAYFKNVPFGRYAGYTIVVSANGYKTSSVNMTGEELEKDNFSVTVTMTKMHIGPLGYLSDILTTVGVVAGVGLAGYLIYKYDMYRGIYQLGRKAYGRAYRYALEKTYEFTSKRVHPEKA